MIFSTCCQSWCQAYWCPWPWVSLYLASPPNSFKNYMNFFDTLQDAHACVLPCTLVEITILVESVGEVPAYRAWPLWLPLPASTFGHQHLTENLDPTCAQQCEWFFKLYMSNVNVDDNPLVGSFRQRLHLNKLFLFEVNKTRDEIAQAYTHAKRHMSNVWSDMIFVFNCLFSFTWFILTIWDNSYPSSDHCCGLFPTLLFLMPLPLHFYWRWVI